MPDTKRFHTRLLLLCLAVFAFQWAMLAYDTSPRSGDTLYTLTLAGNIAQGKGYGLDCIMHFHKLYSGGTWVRDCFRDPLGPLFFALVHLVSGDSYFWPNLLSAALGTFLLPLLCHALGREVLGAGKPAQWAAYATAAHPLLAEYGVSSSYDVLGAVLMMACLLFALRSVRRPRYMLLAALAWSLAYHVKASYLIVLPIAALFALGAAWAKKAAISRRHAAWAAGACGLFLLLTLPWTLHCKSIPDQAKLTRDTVTEYCGPAGDYVKNVSNFCDKIPTWRPKPENLERPPLSGGDIARKAASLAVNFLSGLNYVFLDVFIPGNADIRMQPDIAMPYFGIPFPILTQCERILYGERLDGSPTLGRLAEASRLALGNMTATGILRTLAGKNVPVLLTGLLCLAGVFAARRELRRLFLFFYILAFIGAFSLVSITFVRYLFPLYPLVAILAAGYCRDRWGGLPKKLVAVGALCTLLGFASITAAWLAPVPDSVPGRLKLQRIERQETALALPGVLPPGPHVLLCTNAIWFNYFSGYPTVEMPYAPDPGQQLDTILDVARRYGAEFLVMPDSEASWVSRLYFPVREHLAARDGLFEVVARLRGHEVVRIRQTPAPGPKSD